jgi:hypothetical protein
MSTVLKASFDYVRDLGREAKTVLTTNPLKQDKPYGEVAVFTYMFGLAAALTPAGPIIGGVCLLAGSVAGRAENVRDGKPAGTPHLHGR